MLHYGTSGVALTLNSIKVPQRKYVFPIVRYISHLVLFIHLDERL